MELANQHDDVKKARMTETTNPPGAVARRTFGKTGVNVSKLCLGGGSFMGADSQALLDEALKCGVDCWEIVSFTGNAYRKYFEEHPGVRERVFLSGKVSSTDPATMQEQLDKLLDEHGVSAVDFLAIHAVDDVRVLTHDVRTWAEKAKKDRKIRFFGFCTHKNMAACLDGAADLGWIDGIQTVYNYRLQNPASMEDALRKCHNAGIGIFTVKSMGLCVSREPAPHTHSLNTGKASPPPAFQEESFEQAKLKAIWRNPHVTSVCSLMPTIEILRSNVAAARDEQPLNAETRALLAHHADATGRYYCSRCGQCDTTNADRIPIFNIMEMLMYARRYGMGDWSVKRFAQIPLDIRAKIATSDYSTAERICPQKMPIAQLMNEAYAELNK